MNSLPTHIRALSRSDYDRDDNVQPAFTCKSWACRLWVLLPALLFESRCMPPGVLSRMCFKVHRNQTYVKPFAVLVQEQARSSGPWWTAALRRISFCVPLCLATMFATCGSAFAAAAPAVAGGFKQVRDPALPWARCFVTLLCTETNLHTSLAPLHAGMDSGPHQSSHHDTANVCSRAACAASMRIVLCLNSCHRSELRKGPVWLFNTCLRSGKPFKCTQCALGAVWWRGWR